MSDPRVPMLSPEASRAAAAELGMADMMADLSVFRVLLQNPAVGDALNGMLQALLGKGRLDGRLRELIIMRLGWVSGSVYEWTQHWRVARMIGIPEEDILAVRDWRSADGLSAADRAVLAATDDVVEHGVISAATWDECRAALGDDPAVLVEVVVAICNWQMFAVLLRSLEVPLEDGVEPWPPEGLASPHGGGR